MIFNCECQGGEISHLENGKTAVVETASKGYRNILEPKNQNTSDEERKFLYSVNVELKA